MTQSVRISAVPAILGLAVATLCVPARGQSALDLPRAEEYAQSLEKNFWEEAWVAHLADRADSDSSIDWFYKDRRQLSTLTRDYQKAIEDAEGFWTHLHVQDYLRRQLTTVQPNPMMPGRPGAFRLRVLSTTTPNALALNDGTILITTGLLTALETEAQLRAILAHEVAHIVLDHALATYRAVKKRSRARNLLGSIVSGVTSVVSPGFGRRGSLESTVYGLSSDVATRYLDREFIAAAGLTYGRRKEEVANRLAQEWLLRNDQPPGALYAALERLHRAGTYGNVTHGASFVDNHAYSPDLREELVQVVERNGGDPAALDRQAPVPDTLYDSSIAAVFEHEAELNLASHQFYAALEVLDRALQTPRTTPETFLFKAIAIRNTTTGSDGVAEALALLNEAEAVVSTPEPRIEAERALLRIREGDIPKARQHLARCREQIDGLQRASEGRRDSSGTHTPLREWATKMEVRLRD